MEVDNSHILERSARHHVALHTMRRMMKKDALRVFARDLIRNLVPHSSDERTAILGSVHDELLVLGDEVALSDEQWNNCAKDVFQKAIQAVQA